MPEPPHGSQERARPDPGAEARQAKRLRQVGIVRHPRLPETAALADDLAQRLTDLGVASQVRVAVDPSWVAAHAAALDCLIILGGDGSIVRAARVVAGLPIPILGINLGQLGFLAELQPGELPGRLDALVRGEFRIEERALLRAELASAASGTGSFDALNDAVVVRGGAVRMIAVNVSVDGQVFTSYRGDGVIVATATGSTAYALAVGGPILAPTMDSLVVVPVAPHLVPARALVLPGCSTVRLQLGADHQGLLSVDGQTDQALVGGDQVSITLSPKRVGFVRFGPAADFYGTLFRRLRWVGQNP